ncbi:MAG: hypothetical protein R3D89_12105 [Sphingomonadaceae bacterium]
MAIFIYRNSTGTPINDNSVVSQTVNVYGTSVSPTGVSVTLNGLVHTEASDLDFLLVAPNGTDNLVFWSNAGAGDALNGSYNIVDGVTAIPPTGAIPIGTNGPGAYDPSLTDGDFGSSTGGLNLAATAGSSTFGSAFSGDPTGTWTLYIRDSNATQTGSLADWRVTIANTETTASIDGTVGADSIVITSSSAGAGSWSFNGDLVTFSGVTGGFTINGGLGADTITGGNDNDRIKGGPGADMLDGGPGINTLDYTGSGAGVAIDLGLATASGGDATGDVISNFQNIIGSALADTLYGSTASNNNILGGLGTDTLSGLGGTNVLDGGAGNDILIVTSNIAEIGSTLDGGGANDTLLVIGPTAIFDLRDDTLISLERLEFNNLATNSPTVQVNAVQFGFSELVGQTSASDVDTVEIFMAGQTSLDLSGLTVSNFAGEDRIKIFGDSDVETITGSSADDVIEGGGGGDTLAGGANGAAGDTLSFAGSPAGVSVYLGNNTASGGHAAGDTISGFENLIGSDHNDLLLGESAVDNRLEGGAGNDYLLAYGATNVLLGGTGNDTLAVQVFLNENGSTFDGGADFDELIVGGADGQVDFRDDTLISLEKFRFSTEMSTYQVFFDAPQFTFSEIDFGSPMGEFRTVVVYLDQETVFNLSGITVTGATPGSLLDVIGDDDAETITGSSGPDRLYGFGGADTLRGGDGNDLLYGGLENDNLDGGPGSDTMRGDEGDDIYTVAQVGDTVTESADEGFDTVYAYVDFALDDNTEVLVLRGAATSGTGGAGFNRIYGSLVADTLSGMGDDDVLYGGEGGDALIGGAGNDKLDGGPGNDTMTGGTEDDIYIVAQTADTVVELAMEGTDSVYSYVDYTLSANVENLILRGSAHMATGNAEANSIAGHFGQLDTLTGLAGNDRSCSASRATIS